MVDEMKKAPVEKKDFDAQKVLEQINQAQERLEQEQRKHDRALIARYDEAQAQYAALDVKVKETTALVDKVDGVIQAGEDRIAKTKVAAPDSEKALVDLRARKEELLAGIAEANGGMVQLNEEIQALVEEPAVAEELARREKGKEWEEKTKRENEAFAAAEETKRQEKEAELKVLKGEIDKAISDYLKILNGADFKWACSKEYPALLDDLQSQIHVLQDQYNEKQGLLNKKRSNWIKIGVGKVEAEQEGINKQIQILVERLQTEVKDRYAGVISQKSEAKDKLLYAARVYANRYDRPPYETATKANNWGERKEGKVVLWEAYPSLRNWEVRNDTLLKNGK
ncbi:MAG: hypothetical protein V1763_02990 [Parcubacteria group bacterium]